MPNISKVSLFNGALLLGLFFFYIISLILTWNFAKLTGDLEDTFTTDLFSNTNSKSVIKRFNSKFNEHDRVYPPIPSVVGIGPDKCGTTTLAHYISFQPQIIQEFIKPLEEPSGVTWELRHWVPCGGPDFRQTRRIITGMGKPAIGENNCSPGYYHHYWPVMFDDIRFQSTFKTFYNDSFTNQTLIASKLDAFRWKWYYYFEKTPMYWSLPHVAYIFGEFYVPLGTRFYAQLRHPVKRLYSYFNHQASLRKIPGTSARQKKNMQVRDGIFHDWATTHLKTEALQEMITLLKDSQQTIFQIAPSLVTLWHAYVYKKWPGSDPRRNPDELKPEYGIGSSCYIIQLLMWLEHVPSHLIKLTQSELFFIDESTFVTKFRCWVRAPYEYEHNETRCINSDELAVTLTKQKLVSASRGNPPPEKTTKILMDELYTPCNKRLQEFLDSKPEYSAMMMAPFAWDRWQ